LWLAGGLASPYALVLLLVLTALERRIGGLRAAAVFFGGHALATLATELPVGLSVALGRLPDSSLHRLDYGISFGVMASAGALAGLLPAWLRWPLLGGVGWPAATGLLAQTDPLTDWGHVLALALGVASWPLVRGWERGRVRRSRSGTWEEGRWAPPAGAVIVEGRRAGPEAEKSMAEERSGSAASQAEKAIREAAASARAGGS
jgi:hypothetical protein